MTFTQAVKLKPCPFCGGAATAWTRNESGNSPSVWCRNSVSCGGQVDLHEPQYDAITVWNTRASEDAERPLLERIEKLEAENMRLREALQPFTRENSSEAFLSIRVKSSDVKRARQALGETQ